ncbi:MAG: hypothetical protein HPY85_04320 [Anaerolineae bacterium]|nr:hypothetical protein [Anaerolineae bacterium]
MNFNKICLLPPSEVVHLCNDVYKEYSLSSSSLMLSHRNSGKVPTIVHFAGGVWAEYLKLSCFYYGYAQGLAQYVRNRLLPLRHEVIKTHRDLSKYGKKMLLTLKRVIPLKQFGRWAKARLRTLLKKMYNFFHVAQIIHFLKGKGTR